MSWGFAVYNANGQQTIGIDDAMWLVRFMASVGARSSGSAIIPGISATNYRIIVMPISEYRVYKLPSASLSGDTLIWSDPGAGGCAANILVLAKG